MARNITAPGPLPNGNDSDYAEVSVRKIENGYVTRQSTTDAQGEYSCTETYSQERPTTAIVVNTPTPADAARRAEPSLLRNAVGILNGRRK